MAFLDIQDLLLFWDGFFFCFYFPSYETKDFETLPKSLGEVCYSCKQSAHILHFINDSHSTVKLARSHAGKENPVVRSFQNLATVIASFSPN